MSNDPNPFPSVENLTPFEYALAGVETPEARDSPSLAVIQQMRLLTSEVPETPVTHAGLAELLRTGSVASRRNDRRSLRKRRPTTAADAAASVSDAGGFVDITPIELAEDEKPKADAVGDESIAAAAAVAGAAAIINLDDPTGELHSAALNDVELQTNEFEASDLAEPADAAELDEAEEMIEAAELEADLDVAAEAEAAPAALAKAPDPKPPTMPEPVAVVEPEPEPEPDPASFIRKPAELTSLDQAIVQAQALLAGDTVSEAEEETEEAQVELEVAETEEEPELVDIEPLAEEAPAAEAQTLGQNTIDELIEEVTGAPTNSDADTLENDLQGLDDFAEFEAEFDDEPDLAVTTAELQEEDLTVLSIDADDATVLLEDGSELPMVTAVTPEAVELDGEADIEPGLQPSMFPGVPDDDEFHFSEAPTDNQALTDSDSLDGTELAAEAPIGSDHDRDEEGAVLVGVGAAGVAGILNNTGQVYAPPPSADPIDAFSGPEKPERRRIGGAFWALAGTAAAAAVLVLGGLWWASGLSDRTETDSASAPTSLGDGLDPEDGSVDSGSPSDDDEAGLGAIGENGEELDAPPETGAFGDSEESEPGRSSGSNTSAPTTTSAPQAGDRPATTANNSAQTTVAGDSDSTAGDVTTTTQAPDVTAEPTTQVPETTVVVEQTTVTTLPPETVPPTVAPLAFIGDSVNIGSFGGPGAQGVRVEIYNDRNGNGQPNELVETTTTNANGRYSFNVPGGCYVVRFTTIAGYTIDQNQASQAVCVDAGGARGRIDAILIEPQPVSRPPDGCTVEDNSNALQGVEVYENGGDWADFYIFYNQNGNIVYNTPSTPHDVDGSGNNDWEWVGDIGGFNVRNVYTVAANRGGVNSERISCFRE